MLSVIIPCYNCIRTLEHTVESVCAASPEDCEILLACDGISDGTEALADELAKKHAQIRVLHLPHKGASAARNAALKEAKGEFITFVDSDDLLVEGAFCRMLSHFDDAVDMVVCGQRKIDEKTGEKLHTAGSLQQNAISRLHGKDEIYTELFYRNFGSAAWGRIYRRNVILFQEDKRVLEDLRYIIDYLESHTGDVVRLSEELYLYRVGIKDHIPLELSVEESEGYLRLIESAGNDWVEEDSAEINLTEKNSAEKDSANNNSLENKMKAVYVERMTRRIAKFDSGDRRNTAGKEIIARCNAFRRDASVKQHFGKKERMRYACICNFPALSEKLVKLVLWVMRKRKTTFD